MQEPIGRRSREPIILDSDDETQDVFPNGQDLFADEDFDAPSSPPPGQVSPLNNVNYLDRVERECRERENYEHETQLLSPGYLNMFRNMFEEIDGWLSVDGGQNPLPMGFKRFARHNWTVRLLPIEERFRISKLRYRIDQLIIEENARIDYNFWERVERAEANVYQLNPLCSICRFDLRNEEFTIRRLECGHMFHCRCINRHLTNNNNPRCPNCNENVSGAGEHVQMNYN